jgi:hypothetical protein
MKYLFIDGWGDYSIFTENNRICLMNPIFLQYATLLQSKNKTVFFWDARDKKFSKEKLLNFINKEKIETIIFYTNIDNINSISHLSLRIISHTNVNILFFSINEDLSKLINRDEPNIKSFVYNEKNTPYFNLKIFLELCELDIQSNIIENIPANYSFYEIIKEKTATINIGTGCAGKCNFCCIAKTNLFFRSIDIIMGEIESLLKRGINYFHIMNHSFSCDRNFMEEFCNRLIEKTNSYDFVWSCFIIPNFFVDNLDLLPLMVKAKLKKIEMGCESGSNEILKSLSINHTLSDVEKIIAEAIKVELPAITVHFVVGSPKETQGSLEETKEFIHRLLF